MSQDDADKLWDDRINKMLFDLMHSTNTTENWGGLIAIGAPHWPSINIHLITCTDQLLQLSTDENRGILNLFRFFNYVKHVLPHPDVNLTLAASKTLGQITHIGGAAFGDRFLDFEVPAAVELMLREPTRYGGVLILKEFARNGTGYFLPHIDLVFDNILVPLRDQRVIVREEAAELLAACLKIITQSQPDKDQTVARLTMVLKDAQDGLEMPQAEVIHGSLLTYREFLLHAGEVGLHYLTDELHLTLPQFMKDNYTEEEILKVEKHHDQLVHKEVLAMIPLLAGYKSK